MTTVSDRSEPLLWEAGPTTSRAPWETLLTIRDEIRGKPLAVWEGTRDWTRIGIGAVRRVEASGPDRFQSARDQLDSVRALAMGGFSFADGPGRGGWPGFPGLSFVVPERVIQGIPTSGTFERRCTSPAPVVDRPHAGEPLPPAKSWTQGEWIEAVRRTLEQIRAGAFDKVVLARSRTIQLEATQDPLAIYASLREAYPTCRRFLIDDGSGHAFLGASPEELIRLDMGLVTTEAVAGTLRFGAGDNLEVSTRQLLESAKDRAEHDLVVRHLIEALAPVCKIGRFDPEIIHLPHLLHIRTGLRGLAMNAHVLDLVSRIHPTPAVGGSPRAEALDWIRALEPESRGWYAGGVGWVDADGDGEFAVGIRSIAIRGNQARVFAGAGIVEGSDPEQEWNETELKMQGMLDAIARA
jgi:isochorismate synthase